MQLIHDNYSKTSEKHSERDKYFTVHENSIQILKIETFEVKHGLAFY